MTFNCTKDCSNIMTIGMIGLRRQSLMTSVTFVLQARTIQFRKKV